MRSIEGSSRGGRGYRGGGRGRGSGGGRRGGEDKRFAARLTDPRFSNPSSRGGRGGRGGHSSQRMSHASPRDAAMLSDPRFAKYAAPHQEEQESEEEDEDEEDDEEASLMDSQDEEVVSNGSEEIDEEALAALDQDAAAWSGSEVDFCEATQRFAIVNCDWDHVRAVDLYAILFHSLPLGGQLRHVKVYLSEFGKKMLAHEKMNGPDLWVKPGEADEPEEEGAAGEEVVMEPLDDDEDQMDDDDVEAGGDENDDGWVEDDPAMVGEVGEDGEKFSSGKHRKYERDRMKYYYAVATFDCSETAAAVYGDLDGMDIEGSGVVLDLRYVDDEETFTDPPVDSCSALPPKFKPLGSFKTAALTQTQFRISWDQDDVHRHQSVRDSFTGTTEEDDLMAYIAQDSSDEDDENDPIYELRKKRREAKRLAIRKKYSALLADIGGIPDELPDDKNNDSDENDGNSNQSDDDDLNRFSDVEDDSDDDGGVTGNFESTIDFDADTKAQQLQRDLVKSRQMEAADLGTKSQLKYKMQRKESKAAKREMIEETRKAERAEIEAQRLAHRQSLHDSMGDMVEQEREKRSGKEKRKDHAKKKKEDAAKMREDKKKLRIAGALGVSTSAVSKKNADGAANDTATAIDSRFAGKLVSDPRFHLDVAQKDRRSNQEVVKLASTVIKARQQKDLRPSSSGPGKQPSDDTAVEYFLSRPQKKARKE